MGTGFGLNIPDVEIGIIPRAVEHLFRGIEVRRREAMERKEPPPDFKVNAQFMEVRPVTSRNNVGILTVW